MTKMFTNLQQQFTLLIPTYNRTGLLKKLLNYFQQQSFQFPIIVLDSSTPDISQENSTFIASLPASIQHIIYPSDTHPFDKFADGFQQVATPYCSLCADDDFVLTNAIVECVNFLSENDEYSLAHGLYFDFTEKHNKFTIDRLVYSQPSLDDSSSENRICRLIQKYEATTYAVHRTKIAAKAFKAATSLSSILGNELASSVLCVLRGKAARLPSLYYGRNNQRLTSYSSFHPIEWINISPISFMHEYQQYRKLVLESLAEHSPIGNETYNNFDIAHLCYLSLYIQPKMINFILENRLKNHQPVSPEKLWQYWAELHSRSLKGYLTILRKIKNKILPAFSTTEFLQEILRRLRGDYIEKSALSKGGTNREYCIRNSFLKAVSKSRPISKNELANFICALEHYYLME